MLKRLMAERMPYKFTELFSGDWKLFQKVLQNPNTVFVYDNDGIFSDTSKLVHKRFSDKYGVVVKTSDIDSWTYLISVAKNLGLPEEDIKHVENDFYDPDVLGVAQSVLYIKPVMKKTMAFYGPERNYILTSRNPNLKDSTLSWFERKFPEFLPENILIRDVGSKASGEDFKIEKIKGLASKAPWVVFIDDALTFVKSTLDANIENCLVVNIPQGKVYPDFRHERLFVIKRFPDSIQALYPLMDAIERAFDGMSHNPIDTLNF